MAEIVLGMWTTHGPTLNTTPDQWGERVKADLVNEHWFKGERFTFDELVERRSGEGIAAWITDNERQRRYDACQAGIKALADTWAEVAPDACVILGNDQRELFLEDIQPTFTVYRGETFYNQPTSEEAEGQTAARGRAMRNGPTARNAIQSIRAFPTWPRSSSRAPWRRGSTSPPPRSG